MPLVTCSECGHEVSTGAAACPNCGHPMNSLSATAPLRESGFPAWTLVPIGLLIVGLIFVMFYAFGGANTDGNLNVNVNMAESHRSMSDRPAADTRTESQPMVDMPVHNTTIPATDASTPTPPPPAQKGQVVINARIAQNRGAPEPAKNTKFYLLDTDLETVLTSERVEPIEGNSLTASLGLAVVYPDRYREFYKSAIRAIEAHVKYAGTTDDKGYANVAEVEPDRYHIFGITKAGDGFVSWNAPISIVAGNNVLNLSPQRVTPIGNGNN